jgi:hypothetical protein
MLDQDVLWTVERVQLVLRRAQRAVEIDHVQPLRALGNPVARHRCGVVAEDGFCVGVALTQPHAAPAAQVDCRIDDHRSMHLMHDTLSQRGAAQRNYASPFP